MLHVTITTVEREVLSQTDIVRITLPTKSGEITVLPNHASLMSALGLGEIEIETESGEVIPVFVDGGTVQVDSNEVEILANVAERAEELDEARIVEAQRRAQKLLEEQPIDVDLAQVEASLKRELTKQKLVKKYQR